MLSFWKGRAAVQLASPPRMQRSSVSVFETVETLDFAFRLVSFVCQILQKLKELRWLAIKKAICREGIACAHGRAHGVCCSDDRARRESSIAQEKRRLGHDQVRLQQVIADIDFWEYQTGLAKVSEGPNVVAGLVMPDLEVGRLRRADAEQDAQHFETGHALRQRRIEAAAALLDEGEMKTGSVGDGLSVGINRGDSAADHQLTVVSRDGREFAGE